MRLDTNQTMIIQKLNNGFYHTWGNVRWDNKIGNVIFSVIRNWIWFSRSEELISLMPIIVIWGNLQQFFIIIITIMKCPSLIPSSLGGMEIITFLYLPLLNCLQFLKHNAAIKIVCSKNQKSSMNSMNSKKFFIFNRSV